MLSISLAIQLRNSTVTRALIPKSVIAFDVLKLATGIKDRDGILSTKAAQILSAASAKDVA